MNVIVYTSKTGYTAEYAKLLGEELNLSVLSLTEALKKLPQNADIIYLGWLNAGHIKDYSKAKKQFNIKAVCGVGLMETGEKIDDLRKSTNLPNNIPVFSLQGGFDIRKLTGFYKWSMKLMSKILCNQIAKKENPTESDLKMVKTLKHGGSYVSSENLKEVVDWYKAN